MRNGSRSIAEWVSCRSFASAPICSTGDCAARWPSWSCVRLPLAVRLPLVRARDGLLIPLIMVPPHLGRRQ
ncbi:hypothetical protein FMEAI12_6960002 [Parafrankia sp. Ea1.12]|nr:hypothetical protein FMEAI12_6960002 [Parafrankia sp. Ea1.12]